MTECNNNRIYFRLDNINEEDIGTRWITEGEFLGWHQVGSVVDSVWLFACILFHMDMEYELQNWIAT